MNPQDLIKELNKASQTPRQMDMIQGIIAHIERFKLKEDTLSTLKSLEAREDSLKRFWVLCKGDIVINKSQWRLIKRKLQEYKLYKANDVIAILDNMEHKEFEKVMKDYNL